MRTWGRVPASTQIYSSAIGEFNIGNSPIGANQLDYVWKEVTTDENGFNDAVWLTTLSQVLVLNPGESPMFGNYGVASQQAVANGIPPDADVMLMQQAFSPYFLSLLISRDTDTDGNPVYAVKSIANPGAILMSPVPI